MGWAEEKRRKFEERVTWRNHWFTHDKYYIGHFVGMETIVRCTKRDECAYITVVKPQSHPFYNLELPAFGFPDVEFKELSDIEKIKYL